eukprot:Hpha_TRINITY_DN30961_c0_g1::TRINITY_DN30961_c0_g1_i1::g.112270::m.112270
MHTDGGYGTDSDSSETVEVQLGLNSPGLISPVALSPTSGSPYDKGEVVRARAKEAQQEALRRKREDHERLAKRRSLADDKRQREEEVTENSRRALCMLYWTAVLSPSAHLWQVVQADRARRALLRHFIPMWRNKCFLRRQIAFARSYGHVPDVPADSEIEKCAEFAPLPKHAYATVTSYLTLIGCHEGDVLTDAHVVPTGVWCLTRGQLERRNKAGEVVGRVKPGEWVGAVVGGSTGC